MSKVTPELKILQENTFNLTRSLTWSEIPLPDEPFIQVWEEYIRDIPRLGVLEALRQRLVQLCFPVREGMSTDEGYLRAVRRGMRPTVSDASEGIQLKNTSGLKLYLYQTMAGRIPVLETPERQDFETLVRVFGYRNEPVAIPPSLGAYLIKGYNNWDRVERYKRKSGPRFNFNYLKAHRELYQDVFLILTDAAYSGVPAGLLGLAEDEWRRLSLIIRREHEATHYFTHRLFGSAKNHLLDEFIADYMGITAAVGRYKAHWFLCFMGLENYPEFRSGGRLSHYIKEQQLSKEAFGVLTTCLKNAAENVEKFADQNPDIYTAQGRYEMFLRLCQTNLITLAKNELHK